MLCGKLHPFFLCLNMLVDGVQQSHYTMMNSHQNASWWHHQMETFSVLLVIVWGIHQSPVNFLHKDQWCGALMFSLVWARINGWVNNCAGGDLRRHCAHYDVIVTHNWHHIAWTWWHAMGHLLQFHCLMCVLPLQILFLYCCLCMLCYDCVMIHRAVIRPGPFQYKLVHVTSMGNLIAEILAPYLQNQLRPLLWKYKTFLCSEKNIMQKCHHHNIVS